MTQLQEINKLVQPKNANFDFEGVFAFNLHRFFPMIDALNRAGYLDTGGHFLFHQLARYPLGDSGLLL